MINCDENENDNEKTDHINKTEIDQDVNKDKHVKYIMSR